MNNAMNTYMKSAAKLGSILFVILFMSACASSSNQVQQEVIGGVTITYLTGKPQNEENQQEVPDVYVVQKGDSIFSIAAKYELDYKELAERNGLGGNFVIAPGQELRISSGTAKKPKKKNTKKAKKPVAKKTARKNDKNKAVTGVTVEAPIAEAPAASKEESGFIEAAPPPLAKAGWLWPFKGKPQYEDADGREGVYVSTTYGTAVRAANNGKVIYVGSELKQYQNLILISHSNGYLSVYADNAEILVENEQEIKRGQEIAISGNAYGKGRIYFELRKGSTSINPVDVILDKN